MVYQCFFYSCDRVGYWENLVASTGEAIKARLVAELTASEWQSAEAWLDDELACRVELSMLTPKACA